MARPRLAREAETILRRDGHEVYRTPDDSSLVELVTRVRPHLVIIGLNLPWADSVHEPHHWIERLHPVPVLLIREAPDERRLDGIPRLPAEFDQEHLVRMVSQLLTMADVEPKE